MNTEIPEGHFRIDQTDRGIDCDHGPYTGYYIKELDLWVYFYDNDKERISFSVEEL